LSGSGLLGGADECVGDEGGGEQVA